MEATFAGIPLRSAIIVRHTPNNHRADGYSGNSGAVPVSMASTANDYIGRYGRYAEKGDIERAATAADGRLADDFRSRWADGHCLEYIARLGGFAGKGADRQVDATLWNQYGPVDAAEAARQMAQAGGAFVDSIVTVKREYAERLGLAGKEEMQRLVRSTWTRSVQEWGLIRNASDIRWVAAYHTDADRSLHVHIHTWSARGEIEPGATVGRDATRRAKACVLEVGYAGVRAGRDLRATFLRDLSVLEARRQLGLEVTPEQERRIAERAEREGWPERLSDAPDMAPEAAAKAAALSEKLRAELAQGRGRLSDNYAAQATARDILKTVEKGSPAMSRLAAEYASAADAKAAMKGYGRIAESKEAREFVRAETQDRLKRMANAVIRGHQQESGAHARPLREDLGRLDARGREGWGNVSFSEKLAVRERGGDVEVRIPGTRAVVRIPSAETAEINRGRGRLAAVEESRAYPVVDGRGDMREMTGAELIRRLGPADMIRIAENNPEYPDRQREAEGQRQARRAAAERRERERAREAAPDAAQLRAQSDYSVKHGISLSDAALMGRESAALARSLAGTGATRWEDLQPRDRARVDRIASTLVTGSAPMRAALERTAESMSARSGVPREQCLESLRAEAVRQTRDAVVQRAESGALSKHADGTERTPGMGAAEAIASIVEAIASSAGQAQASSRRAHRHTRQVERDVERDPERGRD